MKKIVFINQDSGYLMIDIVNAHVKEGFDAVLLTGRLLERNTPLDSTVVVDRIIRYQRDSNFIRIYTWLIGFIQIWIKVCFKYRKADLFIVTNPPFATLLPLFVRNRFTLLIFDIYPDALTETGLLSKKSALSRFWESVNMKVYAKAERIFTLSNGMKSKLESYVHDEKIDVVYPWSDSGLFRMINKNENPFIIENNLQGKFIVLYSGNMGFTHHVELIPELSKTIDRDDIVFVMIGEGDKKKQVQDRIFQWKLDNCILLPWQPFEILPFSLASADIGIVSLGTNASQVSIPSKTFNLMSAGVPLLCLASETSELAGIVNKYYNGACFDPVDLSAIRDFILQLADNPVLRNEMCENSRKASFSFGPENARLFVEAG